MKKLKQFTLAGFFLVCALCAAVILALYPRIQIEPLHDYEEVDSELTTEIQWLILGKVQELDPEYTYIQSSDPALVDRIEEMAQSSIRQAVYALDNDDNFAYRIEYNGQMVSSHFNEECTQDNALFYSTLDYDETGALKQEGNINASEFGFLSLGTFYDLDYLVAEANPTEGDYVTLVPPHNVKVTLFIPETLQANSGLVYNAINNYDGWAPFLVCTTITGAIIISLYILVVDYKSLKNRQPFSTLLSWKAEFNVCFLSCMVVMMYAFASYILWLTVNDILIPAMTRYGIPAAWIWANIANFALLFLAFYLTGLSVYYIKYALCSGFVRFLKEDSWIGNRIVSLTRGLKDLSDYDLDGKLKQLILRGVILNTGVMFLISLFWMWPLAFVYGVASYIFLIHRVSLVMKEYNVLLERMDKMAQGDFQALSQNTVDILPALQGRLNTLQDDFELALKDRVRSQNLKTELITNVSHDLKTPLTGIKNYLELLNDERLTQEEKEEYLARLNQYTDRLSKLIEDLFEISKANSGNIDLDVQKIDIGALVEQVLVENESLLEKKRLVPVFKKPQENLYCLLDGDKCVRIFENLFSNVAKYALENTRVFVTMERKQDKVVITIQNISKTPLDFDPQDITERFVRADQSRHEEGSGLGLAIVKSFCEIQNGRFEVQIDGDVFKAVVQFKTGEES